MSIVSNKAIVTNEVCIEPIYEDGELLHARFILFEVDEEGHRQIRDICEHRINTSTEHDWLRTSLMAARFFNQAEILSNGMNYPVTLHANHKSVDLGKAMTLQTKLLKIIRHLPRLSEDYDAIKAAEALSSTRTTWDNLEQIYGEAA